MQIPKIRSSLVNSKCMIGDKIQPGKEITKNQDEEWVHKHCTEDSEGLP